MVKGARPMRRGPDRRHSIIALVGLALALIIALYVGVSGARLPAGPAFAQEQPGAEVVQVAESSIAVAPRRVHQGKDGTFDQFTLHVPAGAREPLTVLVALHGMGGNGEDFIAPLLALTDPLGWVVVAPTFNYGDWRDPAQVTSDETRNLPEIAAFLDRLPGIVGMDVNPMVYEYGFSRGGQTAERFALVYPERVAGVAAASSGTYTLPSRTFGATGLDVPFPYGMADCAELFGVRFDPDRLARVPFWIGVGRRDANPADVPHQWDPYIGDDRVERAGRIASALRGAGVRVEVDEFPDTGHVETAEVRAAAVQFLASLRQPSS